MADCLFCKIVNGEIPSEKVYEDEYMIVFKDIAPKAEIHLVGTPKLHFKNISEFTAKKPGVASHFVAKMSELGVEKSGGNSKNFEGQFKLLFNTGEKAGQTIFHVHAHILAGTGLETLC